LQQTLRDHLGFGGLQINTFRTQRTAADSGQYQSESRQVQAKVEAAVMSATEKKSRLSSGSFGFTDKFQKFVPSALLERFGAGKTNKRQVLTNNYSNQNNSN
jgi:hypothetical protein